MHDTVVVVVVIVVMMVTMICSIVLQGSLIFIVKEASPLPLQRRGDQTEARVLGYKRGLPLAPPKEGRPNGGVGLRFTNLT